MKGIELSRGFYIEYGMPMLKKSFPELLDKIAVGLVGHGSECFGFDDDISKDHDFSAGFCIWLPEEYEHEYGFKLSRVYSSLPNEYMGIVRLRQSGGYTGRGVMTIEDFYRRYTGNPGVPNSIKDWLYLPAQALAEAVNGEVFYDPLGKFTGIRNKIKAGMPEDVRLKRIASLLFDTAQSGQYNFKRCLAHGEYGAAVIALSKFMESYASVVCLINSVYPPYYKWLIRTASLQPLLGAESNRLNTLQSLYGESPEKCQTEIELICKALINVLIEHGLCRQMGDFLEPYCYAVNDKIHTEWLRNMPVML